MGIETNKYLLKANIKPEQCKFANLSEQIAAQSDPLYAKDPEFRALVAHTIQNTDALNKADNTPPAAGEGFVTGRQLSRAMADVPSLKKINEQAIAEEHTRNLFMKRDENGDLLYEKSAIYREQVRQILEENTPAIDATMGHRLRDVNVSRQAFRVELGTQGDTTEAIREGIRASKIEAARVAANERKAEIDASLEGEIEELNATTRQQPEHDGYSPR